MRIVLTGPPGCGKTTAVMTIVGALRGRLRVAGFYTQEIRKAGQRQGFRWHSLDGRTGILAHVDVKSPRSVSKYGVDIESFDKEAVSVLEPNADHVDLFVVDEIGKMECFSDRFVAAIQRLLNANVSLLATVAQKGSGLIQEVKNHPGVKLLRLTRENRDEVARQVADMLAGLKQ